MFTERGGVRKCAMLNYSATSPPGIQTALEQLYLPTEVADALRYHIESVRRAIRQGRIKAIKTGRQWRVARAELDRLLREGL